MAKYSKAAGKKVGRAVGEMEVGKLKSGRSGKKVSSRKQAIAIGLSEARAGGARVPEKPSAPAKKARSEKTSAQPAAGTIRKVASPAAKKTASQKTSVKKATGSKTAAPKKVAKKAAADKTASKSATSKKQHREKRQPERKRRSVQRP